MWRPRIPIQDPPFPKIRSRCYTIQRYSKLPVPQPLRGHAVKNFAQLLEFFVRPLDLFRVRLDKLFPNLQFLRRKLPFLHFHHRAANDLFAARRSPRYFQFVLPWRFLEVHSNQPSLYAFLTALLPERHFSPTPIPFHFRQSLRSLQFNKQQTPLARFRRAQAQFRSWRASSRFFPNRSCWQKACNCHQTHKDQPLTRYIAVNQSHFCCRIAATRASTFSNCARAVFDPRIAFSIIRNNSGLFSFSRISGRKGRTFAKMKYSSPQNAS